MGFSPGRWIVLEFVNWGISIRSRWTQGDIRRCHCGEVFFFVFFHFPMPIVVIFSVPVQGLAFRWSSTSSFDNAAIGITLTGVSLLLLFDTRHRQFVDLVIAIVALFVFFEGLFVVVGIVGEFHVQTRTRPGRTTSNTGHGRDLSDFELSFRGKSHERNKLRMWSHWINGYRGHREITTSLLVGSLRQQHNRGHCLSNDDQCMKSGGIDSDRFPTILLLFQLQIIFNTRRRIQHCRFCPRLNRWRCWWFGQTDHRSGGQRDRQVLN